ncbi:outer membrane autotransporter protein [Ochrobactrum anthropi]|nr:putative Ig domain-containing protein [Brucella anthropi]MBA8862429.1 outer membrane autotransporter protein [Brucella anthropi]
MGTHKVGKPVIGVGGAAGGISPYSFNLANYSSLPPGLSLDKAEGKLTGTPTRVGSYSYDVIVTDSMSYTATVKQTIKIVAASDIDIDLERLPNGKVGADYGSQKLQASGGKEPYTYTLSGLPAGLIFDGVDTISGTPTEGGSFTVQVTVTDAENDTVTKSHRVSIDADHHIDMSTVLPNGKINVNYGTHQLISSGGSGPYSYSVTGLPSGLTFDGIDRISGTPIEAGAFTAVITITDATGAVSTVERHFTIESASDISIDLNVLVNGKVGLNYGPRWLVATGGTAPYNYTVSGLPLGLSFDGVDAISGVPTKAGTSNVEITTIDAKGNTATHSKQIIITDAPVLDIGPADLPTGKVGVNYGLHKLQAFGGTAPYEYSVNGLPAGLALDGDTISGTPTEEINYGVRVTVKDAEGYTANKEYTVRIDPASVIDLDLSVLPTGKVGKDYGPHKLAASGGTAPYTYVVTGLPDGLTASGDTISGKPTMDGSFEVEVTATDADGYTVSKKQTVVIEKAFVIDLDLSVLPTGKVGQDYGSHKLAASGGTAPYTYVVTGLPDGLTASGDTISGTPTTAGSFDVVVTITDADGSTINKTQTIVIAAAPSIVIAALPDGEQGQNYGPHQLTATGGTGPYSYAMAGLPGGLVIVGDTITGTPTTAGSFPVTVTVKDANGYTVTHTVNLTIHLAIRPDPSLDPEVIGLVNAQVETANRMAQMQIRNFGQRLEQLHGEGDCRQDSIGLSVGLDGAQLNPKMPQACSGRELSLWTAGEVNMGKSSSGDHDKDRKLDHTSIGVSGGVDYRFSPSFTGGIGFGYGKDTTDIGENGTKSRATMTSLAAYGSYRPGKNFFLDGVVGYGWLDFKSDRFVTATGGMASGERKGQQIFGSVTLGYDYRNEAWLLSPYLRADMAHTKLEGFSETGAGIHNLTYGDQTANMLSATIGLRGEYTFPMSWGELKPKARLEYSHDFAGSSKARIGYADMGGLLPYTIDANAGAKDNLKIEAGFDATINGDWTAGLDYSTQIGTGGGKLEHGFRWKLSKKF